MPTSENKPQSKSVSPLKVIPIVVLIIVVVNAINRGLGVSPASPSSTDSPAVVTMSQAEQQAIVAESEKVTKEEYDRLKTGMSYEQAAAVIGADGEELSSNEIGGTKTIMYKWQGAGIGNMNAIFQNDKLVSKSQFELK